MSSNEQNNATEIRYATVANSGSGNVFYHGGFVPTPTIPINGSNLPNPHPHFVGREDKIQEVMNALSSRAWIIGIDGMGGIGKTTLALEVAHLCKRHDSNYPEVPHFTGYVWVSARNKLNFGLRDVIREILYVLSPFENIKRKLSDAEQISLASRVLALEPRLLIIDNFETVQEDELLYKFLEEFQSPSKALITSRLRINTGEKVVTLGGLAEKDAVKLLLFEADRLGIPIDEQDMARMRIISRKTFGIPFVLRWVMERIREGQTLEWAVESLEHATAKDIFGYIFNSSLSLLDPPTRKIFRSMALLSTWTSIETISAMNAELVAIPDRLSDLVKYSLVEDNLKLAPSARRYQLHPFTRYLASQELFSIDDRGAHIAKNALRYYLNNLLTQKKVTPAIQEYLEMEFANIQEVVRFACTDVSHDLVDECIQVLKALKEVDLKKGMMLLPYLVEASRRTGNQKPALQLLGIIGNPYFNGTPVRDPSMFFGREDILGQIQESFDRNPSSAIAITGPRRVGKTSLLYQLHSHWRDNLYWVHIDLQAFLLGEGIAPFLFGIIHEINDELNSRGIRDKEMSSQLIVHEVDFKRRPLLAFAHYIQNVHHLLGDAHLVLLFDEFDLISRFINEDSSGDFSNWLLYLRSLVIEGALGIITAGVRPLIELVYDDELKSSPFFNIFTPIHMAAISRESATELIQRPTSGLLHYDRQYVKSCVKVQGLVELAMELASSAC